MIIFKPKGYVHTKNERRQTSDTTDIVSAGLASCNGDVLEPIPIVTEAIEVAVAVNSSVVDVFFVDKLVASKNVFRERHFANERRRQGLPRQGLPVWKASGHPDLFRRLGTCQKTFFRRRRNHDDEKAIRRVGVADVDRKLPAKLQPVRERPGQLVHVDVDSELRPTNVDVVGVVSVAAGLWMPRVAGRMRPSGQGPQDFAAAKNLDT